MNNSNVLIITYYWAPSGGAGVQRWLKFAKYLPEFGVNPIILTVDEHFAAYPSIDKSLEKEVSPDLNVYKTKSREILNFFSKTTGKKLPQGGFANVDKESFVMKISRFVRGNFFIPDARRGWNKYAYKKACELIKQFDIKTVITTSPPHSVQLIGLKLKRKFGIRWIADLRDPWSDVYYNKDLMRTKLADFFDKRLEKTVLEQADELITVCDSVKNLLLQKTNKISGEKIHIVLNGFDNSDFQNLPEIKDEAFRITYVGTIALSYNAKIIFDSIKKLSEQNPNVPYKLIFVGSVPDSVKAQISEAGILDKTDFVGYLPHNEAIEYMKNASVLVNVFPESADYDGVPGKFAEYIASRRPIISIDAHTGDAAKILAHTQSGKTFTRNEQSELELYFQELTTKWLTNKTLKLDDNLNIQEVSRKFGTELIKNVILKKK